MFILIDFFKLNDNFHTTNPHILDVQLDEL